MASGSSFLSIISTAFYISRSAAVILSTIVIMPPRSLNEPSTCRRRQWIARHPARPEGDRRAATSYVGRPASSSAVPTLHHSAAREDCAQDTPQDRKSVV